MERQAELCLPTPSVPFSPQHVFNEKPNRLLAEGRCNVHGQRNGSGPIVLGERSAAQHALVAIPRTDHTGRPSTASAHKVVIPVTSSVRNSMLHPHVRRFITGLYLLRCCFKSESMNR